MQEHQQGRYQDTGVLLLRVRVAFWLEPVTQPRQVGQRIAGSHIVPPDQRYNIYDAFQRQSERADWFFISKRCLFFIRFNLVAVNTEWKVSKKETVWGFCYNLTLHIATNRCTTPKISRYSILNICHLWRIYRILKNTDVLLVCRWTLERGCSPRRVVVVVSPLSRLWVLTLQWLPAAAPGCHINNHGLMIQGLGAGRGPRGEIMFKDKCDPGLGAMTVGIIFEQVSVWMEQWPGKMSSVHYLSFKFE